MDNPFYVTLSRQVGLDRAMRIVANNIANISTDGFRREGAVFVEWVDRIAVDGGALAQTGALARTTEFSQGALRKTAGRLDLAIEGDAFFMLETPEGLALTRAGAFTRAADGSVVAPDGARLLDQGGGPVILPPGALEVDIASDGSLSVDGAPVAQVGKVSVADPSVLERRAANRFDPANAELLPAPDAIIAQGFLESSNVNPVRELTRMIEIQRAYEAGQSLMKSEDERQRQAIRVMGSAA